MTIDAEKLAKAVKAYGPLSTYAEGSDTWMILAAAEAYLSENPPPAPKDHVVVVFTRATGTAELFKSSGDVLMTKENAMTRAKQWSHDYPGSTYTVVQVGQ